MPGMLKGISTSTPYIRKGEGESSPGTQRQTSTKPTNRFGYHICLGLHENTQWSAFSRGFLFKTTFKHLTACACRNTSVSLLRPTSLTRFQTRNLEDGTWLLVSDKPQQLPHCHPILVWVTKIDRSSHSFWKWYCSQHEDHYMVDVFIVR